MGKLVCTRCKTEYPLDAPIWKCDCGSLLDIVFQPSLDPDRVKNQKPTLWRYQSVYPVDPASEVISFDEGFTPLLPIKVGGKEIFVKQDHLFPTGSYKDRGASVLITQVKSLGIHRVVEDSSGNAGCAIAAYCARAGIECAIYVPEDTSPGKLAQIAAYGAELHKIPGTREDTARAVWEAAQSHYYASHSWNPFFFQGTKSFAYEVCEQLGWKAPDTVVLPAGNGTLLLGAAIGFEELLELGIIQKIPRLIGVQSANCAPMAEAFKDGLSAPVRIQKIDTLAEGIAIAEPVRGEQMLRTVQQSRGAFITVEEEEIKAALKWVSKMGYYIEPTSAATIAGLEKYVVGAESDEVIVSVFTGHGLKATEKMMKL